MGDCRAARSRSRALPRAECTLGREPAQGPARPAVQRGEAATLRCVPTRHTAPAVTQPCGGRLWGQRPALPVLPAKAREWATGTFPFPQFELCFHLPGGVAEGLVQEPVAVPTPTVKQLACQHGPRGLKKAEEPYGNFLGPGR